MSKSYSNVWGVRLLSDDALSATCLFFENTGCNRSLRPKIEYPMMESMSPASIQQRLTRKVSSEKAAGLDHAQRWRQEGRDVDPLLVVAVKSEDADAIYAAKAFCAKASQEVLLAVLLVCRSSGREPDSLYEVTPWEYPGKETGATWCTLEIRSTNPYTDAIRITDALTLRAPGLIGVNFQDVMTTLADGRAGVRVYDRRSGEKRAERAATYVLRKLTALGIRLRRARGLFVHMTSDRDLKHGEVKTIADLLHENVGKNTDLTLSHAYRKPARAGAAHYLELDAIVTFDETANTPSKLEAGSVFGNQIDNEDLTTFGIPPANAKWADVIQFALTFDGHQYWGSHQAVVDIAAAHLDRSLEGLGLTELRTCLFFEQRKWRDNGHPHRKEMAYIRALVEEIRHRVRLGNSTSMLAMPTKRKRRQQLYSGGDGASRETAIVIGATRTARGVPAEYEYIIGKHGLFGIGWKLISQELEEFAEKKYDILTIKLASKKRRLYYFDITNFYGKRARK